MALFNFLDMLGSYQNRKVDRFEGSGGLIVDTCAVTDSELPYETAVSDGRYNGGNWIVVELYEDINLARLGHEKWVKTMTQKELPKTIKEVSTSDLAKLCDVFDNKWRDMPRV